MGVSNEIFDGRVQTCAYHWKRFEFVHRFSRDGHYSIKIERLLPVSKYPRLVGFMLPTWGHDTLIRLFIISPSWGSVRYGAPDSPCIRHFPVRPQWFLSLNGHFAKKVPAILYSRYLTLYKTDITLRPTFSADPDGVRLREGWLLLVIWFSHIVPISFTEKHRLDFSGFTSNGGFADLLSTREAVISSGDGVDSHMKVLGIQGNATLRFDTTGDDCLNEPSLCPGGFAVSFWLKNERTCLYSAFIPFF